jgi:uracil-DNA glycosylase
MQMHPVEELWHQQHPVAGYPQGVIAVTEAIPGVAFFPGGFGLWRPDIGLPLPKFPIGQTMVLGHDFHSEAGYKKSLLQTRESEAQPTWRNLVTLLLRVGIALESCFFTNVYMGLRAGVATTGPFPGASDPEFVAHCTRFLAKQIAAQRPSLIITLGIHVPPILATLSPQLAGWIHCRSLRELDEFGPVQAGVRFGLDGSTTATVVALTHPSLRNTNVRHRRYGEEIGDAAEIAMMRDALASVALAHS